jgi:F-type H+-transporting ATPase subunit a
MLCLIASLPVRAAGVESAAEGGEIDAQAIIFSHIKDSYEWHITKIGETHVTIPLPIIAYSRESGWHLFLSSKFHHSPYEGLYIASEGTHEGKLVETNAAGEEVRPMFDISITKNALALMINSLVLVLLVMSLVRWYKRNPERSTPRGLRGGMEMFIMDINDNLIKPCIGPDYRKYAPYLLTAFFFILTNNLMGLIPFFPGGASTTGNIAVTLVLSLCTFVAVNLFGNKEYWEEVFWPDVPVWMKAPIPLMPAIELFGVISKPFALTIRLFANIMAGHAIILGLTSIIFITVSMGPVVNAGMTALSVIMTIFMSLLELLVAYIQAYVFTMLSAVFIGLAHPEAHHKPKEQKIKTK